LNAARCLATKAGFRVILHPDEARPPQLESRRTQITLTLTLALTLTLTSVYFTPLTDCLTAIFHTQNHAQVKVPTFVMGAANANTARVLLCHVLSLGLTMWGVYGVCKFWSFDAHVWPQWMYVSLVTPRTISRARLR